MKLMIQVMFGVFFGLMLVRIADILFIWGTVTVGRGISWVPIQ